MIRIALILMVPFLLFQSKVYCQSTDSIKNYLTKHIRYRAMEKENDITGQVIVKFTINKNHKLVNIQLVKSLDKDCDEEVLTKLQDYNGQNIGIKPRSYTVAVNFISIRTNSKGTKDTLNKLALKNTDTDSLLQIKIVAILPYIKPTMTE